MAPAIGLDGLARDLEIAPLVLQLLLIVLPLVHLPVIDLHVVQVGRPGREDLVGPAEDILKLSRVPLG